MSLFRKYKFHFSVILFSGISLISCDNAKKNLISQHGQSKSHKAGRECLECHRSGGSGSGNFALAGTVYQSDGISVYPNASIQIWTESMASGTILETIEVDAKGNFFTTDPIEINSGYFFAAVDNNLAAHMLAPVTNGACNDCHDSQNSRIILE